MDVYICFVSLIVLSCSFQVLKHTVVCSLHFKNEDLEISGFSGRWYLKPGSVPSVFQCWEHKPYLTSKPPKERTLNKFQLRSSETSCRKRKAGDERPNIFEAEPVKDCVDPSEAATDLPLVLACSTMFMKENCFGRTDVSVLQFPSIYIICSSGCWISEVFCKSSVEHKTHFAFFARVQHVSRIRINQREIFIQVWSYPRNKRNIKLRQ